jgi:NADP+-dependent farnesol dehydrogenase
MVVIGLARRHDRIEALKQLLPENVRKNLHPIKCDVSEEQEIVATFAEIEQKFGGVDVLVNNAGINRQCQLIDVDNSRKLREVVDTNVLGVVFCTREAVKTMRKRGDNGHVVNINSLLGHQIPFVPNLPSFNIYPATKHAVTALTESLRQELLVSGSKIRVTVSYEGNILRNST